MKDLTCSETIVIIVGGWIIYLIVSDIIKRLFKKKKPKFNKEYEVKIFKDDIGAALYYSRDEVKKVKMFGRKYIIVYLKDGNHVEYEGFFFIVKTYKIKIDETRN